ncbi:hypothetical protein Vretimale_13523 [Volvox reticuliferus]|uniref:Uncharacterized protein n=1 Tax=Volvox reticuliferus TaxID=1737510 RepID=A0A8J4C196_9CHLO|nr:hypothetical protein Vretifemale_347 [Volvox reticuliferus]GIM09680.1 hypothetical protein Vretimale_13523 [Volvox reticuliferus]
MLLLISLASIVVCPLTGWQGQLLDLQVQFATARRNTWCFLIETGFAPEEARKLLDGIFSGTIVSFRAFKPCTNDAVPLAAGEPITGLSNGSSGSSLASSCDSFSPGEQIQRQAQVPHQRRPRLGSRPLDAPIDSNVEFCFSSTKDHAACQAAAMPVISRSPDPCTPRPCDCHSPRLSLSNGSKVQIPFAAWAADLALAAADGSAAKLFPRNVVSHTRAWSFARGQTEYQPPSAGLSPVSGPAPRIPFAEWAQDALSDSLDNFLTTPVRGTPGSSVGCVSEQQPTTTTSYLRMVSQAPQNVSFADWGDMQQQEAVDDTITGASSGGPMSQVRSLCMLAQTGGGSACSREGSDRDNNRFQEPNPEEMPVHPMRQQPAAAVVTTPVRARARGESSQMARAASSGCLPGSPVPCRKGSGPQSPC